MSDIRPIRTARDHKAALAEIDALLAAAKVTRAQGERLEVLTDLVNDYEDRAFSGGRERTDRSPRSAHGERRPHAEGPVGRGLASLILSRQRGMSLAVIRKISAAWGIPADS